MIRLILFITILTVATYTSYAKDFLDAGNRYVAGKFDLKAANKYSVKLGHIPVRIKATIEAGTPLLFTPLAIMVRSIRLVSNLINRPLSNAINRGILTRL